MGFRSKVYSRNKNGINEATLKKWGSLSFADSAEKIGQMGVEALAAATPKRTGKTADSWAYEIRTVRHSTLLYWYNTNLAENWFPVALGLQYGHVGKNGSWVPGNDYINPAMEPVFEAASAEAVKKVSGK